MISKKLSNDYNDDYTEEFKTKFVLSLYFSYNFILQGSLVGVYTTPSSYHDIDTLKELDESGISIAVRHQGLIVDIFGDAQPGSPLGMIS